jgi:hypothetical protein
VAAQAAMGMALGLGFCWLAALINPSDITSLIAHDAQPRMTAVILVGFFALFFGAGAALTGIVLMEIEKH